MRATQIFINTLREDPADAQISSHRLMLRAGLVFKQASGLYSFLPLGLRVMRKIESIVREEMNKSGAVEFQVPILTNSELWQKSLRWQAMGKELFRVQDRHSNWHALGPTHEESFTELMTQLIKSYKELPLNMYQIHPKFRDEIRPRFGMIRAREFVMKDAYSFHVNDECLESTYQNMRQCYRRIFKRVGLETIAVQADSGAMGGLGSEEFMVCSEIGEDVLLLSEDYTYSSNREKTPVLYPELDVPSSKKETLKSSFKKKKVHTPNSKTIDEVAQFFKCNSDMILKAVFYIIEEGGVLVFIRGDREVNEVKLANHLSQLGLGAEFHVASINEIESFGFIAGFIGPENLDKNKFEIKKTKENNKSKHLKNDEGLSINKERNKVRVLLDRSVLTRETWITGANEKDYHYQSYDFMSDSGDEIETVDLALARAGDLVPIGKHLEDEKFELVYLKEVRGIEVGHIFKLGLKYTQAFGTKILDEHGKTFTPTMGCYGIGINRTLATIIEQNHDEKGIIWPLAVAPFEILLVSITKDEKEEGQVAEFYNVLLREGFDVLWDDRKLRPGVKFSDAELIGYPLRITLGKNFFSAGVIEIQIRKNLEMREIKAFGGDEEVSKSIFAIREICSNLGA